MNKIYVDDFVKFVYNGGSNPGSTRMVYVVEEGDTYFRGWDFTKDDLRTFSHDKVDKLTFVDDFKAVRVAQFPGELSDPQTWADKYEAEGYKTFIYDGEEVIAVKLPELPKPRLLRSYMHSNYFCFDTKDGTIRGVKLTRNSVDLFEGGKNVYKNATVEDLIKFLSE